MRNSPTDALPIFEVFNRIPLRPLYAVAALAFVGIGVFEPGDWRLLSVALTALAFNLATILLTLMTGLFSSSIAKKTASATGIAYGILAVLSVATFLIKSAKTRKFAAPRGISRVRARAT